VGADSFWGKVFKISRLVGLYSTQELIIGILMVTSRAYEEVIDFLAAGTTPSNIVNFHPSEETKQRVADLIYREKTIGLTRDETSELDRYIQLEHLMRLTKARARKYLSEQSFE
jgi:hypothetical protein